MGMFLNSIFFSLIINQFVLHLPAVAAKDVLIPGDELNSLASAGGKFTLGFFTIQSTNLTYLGIWYTNDDRKIWVANRDNPMNSSGVLMIDKSGTLKVISGNNTTLFNVSKQVVGSGINTRAVLDDSGNFVLYDNATILWQSFDHPTDTVVPGMKLGYNLTTGQNWTLTSWLSDQEIPASGPFTMRLEQIQDSPQLVIYRRGKLYRTSGPWEHGRFRYQTSFNGIVISDASGTYFSLPTNDIGVISMLQLSFMGEILLDGVGNSFSSLQDVTCYQSDNISDEFQVDEVNGCAISPLPNCRSLDYDTFSISIRGFRHGVLIQSDDSSNISLSDCMERCWNDCNCESFYTISISGTGCRTWGWGEQYSDDDADIQNTVGVFSQRYKPLKKINWTRISVFVAIVLTCALTAPFCYVRIRRRMLEVKEKRRRNDYIHQLTYSDSFNYGDVLEKGIKDAYDIKIFSLKAILAATDSFSIENKLGQGGYGPVYKGKLFDGREIAVKRLSKASGQGIEEFKNELILISKLQHTNLVRLYGCCIHQEEKMLIYEFMPNKSLDFFIFAEDKKETINWQIRFNIIEGIAQGLLYLHKYSRMKVIHRDLKVSNVLLDENMNPKIADFGMARIFQQNMTEAITNRVVGTYGYMAPEYAIEGTFSIKSDVFSFGVLILEIVSGKRNSRFHDIDRPLNLVGYAWELWKVEAALELKDEALHESFDQEQMFRTIHVGLLCVQDNADDRPTMFEVISMLNNEITDLPNPKQPIFIIGRQPVEDFSSKNIPISVNGLSITMMEAR